MITVTALQVTKLAPEFAFMLDGSNESEEIDNIIELAQEFVNADFWGESKGSKAISLLTAHFLSELGFSEDASSGSVAGAVTSEKVGDLERKYEPVNLTKGSVSDQLYNTTKYGRQFLLLRRTLYISPMVT